MFRISVGPDIRHTLSNYPVELLGAWKKNVKFSSHKGFFPENKRVISFKKMFSLRMCFLVIQVNVKENVQG